MGIGVVLALAWTLVPIYWMINMTLMFEREIYLVPPHFWPHEPTVDWFTRILGIPTAVVGITEARASYRAPLIWKGIQNGILVAIPVAIVTVLVGSVAGYSFGRFEFRHKTTLLIALLLTRAAPPIAMLIPFFFLFFRIGLIGTLQGLMIGYLSMTLPLVTWVLTGYFATLPVEAERAARIDGCTRLGALRKVLIPMAAPGIAACGILAFLIAWNEFIFAYVLTAGTDVTTLTPVLFGMQGGIPALGAASILSMVPPAALALVFQRYITRLRIVYPTTVSGAI